MPISVLDYRCLGFCTYCSDHSSMVEMHSCLFMFKLIDMLSLSLSLCRFSLFLSHKNLLLSGLYRWMKSHQGDIKINIKSSSRLTGKWESSINRLATYTTYQRDLRVLNVPDSPGRWTKSITPQTNWEPFKKEKGHSRFVNGHLTGPVCLYAPHF